MGAVYRCEDTSLGEEVAVKRLPDALAGSEQARQRLRREVAGARKLGRRNIVRIFEYLEPPGGEPGPVGYTMELLPGANLADHLAGEVEGSPLAGPATVERLPWVAALADQLCDAVDFVHRAGLVHRDIKPSNVMVLDPGAGDPGALRIKLLDFGVVHTGPASSLTGDLPPGTREYMAHELLAGLAEPGPAVDIYSLGKVLYLALTGTFPRHEAESDPPSGLLEGLPAAVDDVLLSSLSARPDRRPAKAADLAGALRSAVDEVEEARRAAVEEFKRKAEAEATRKSAEQEAARTQADQEASRRKLEQEAARKKAGQGAAREEAEAGIGGPSPPSSSGPSPPSSSGPSPIVIGGVVVLVVLVLMFAVVKLAGNGGSDLAPADRATSAPTLTSPSETTPDPPTAELPNPDPPIPEPAVATNPAGIDWVRIPGGTFAMGSNDGNDDEKPVHDVSVPSFELGRTEVTVAQYRTCVDAGKCTEPKTGSDYNWGVSGKDDHPINGVTWNQARTFASWSGGRLPSEAEWEYAARSGGKSRTWPWGDAEANCSYAVLADGENGCGKHSTWAVCSKSTGNTDQGLCDMVGNVREWVEDCYEDTYAGAPTDGTARTSGVYRVHRGGSWTYTNPHNRRVASRESGLPSWLWKNLGFRLARDVP